MLVMPSPTTPLSGENETTFGAPGAVVSMVTLSAAEAVLRLPTASSALAVKAWLPLASVPVANDHAPPPSAVAVPIWVAPSNTSTVMPAVAIPVRVTWLTLVMPSPVVPLSGENEATVGVPGGVVSICSVPARLAGAPDRLATLPAPSLMVAVPELIAVTARSDVFCPAATVYLKRQRIGAAAACIGRGAAVVQGERRVAAGNRHRLAQVERQRHHAAHSQIAATSRDAGAGRRQ